MTAKRTTYFEIEVTLLEIKPPIWRSFLLRTNSNFHELHDTIQKACGWSDYHLYEFRTIDSRECVARPAYYQADSFLDGAAPEADELILEEYFNDIDDKCLYIYDFGDYWQHQIRIKDITRIQGTFRRKLTGGQRTFPLEDCGSTIGYQKCLEALRITDKKLSELDEYAKDEILQTKEWMGNWHPEKFDFEQTAKQLRKPVRSTF
jgi:hypothetical protein